MSVSLLTRLDGGEVDGVSMANVSLLRLDLTGGNAPGNKHFKLRPVFQAAHREGIHRLVSFGGPWSNHLHALAALGREQDLQTVGIVRADDGCADTAMLAEARAWGMHIERVSRSEFRLRNEADYLAAVAARFAPCKVIPEGGAGPAGVRGCGDIATLLRQVAPWARRILLPVGTGTTLAGVVRGLGSGCEVIGISALRGATDLESRVQQALAGRAVQDGGIARWQILHQEHCGGFARVTAPLQAFILAFERVHGVPLDPVYTAKMLYAIHRRLRAGEWSAQQPLLAIHTGGLQGRRGFDWLA